MSSRQKLTEDQMKERRDRERVSDKKHYYKFNKTVKGTKQLTEKRLKTAYDMTGKDWERMYEKQNGICKNPDCDFTFHNRWWEQGNGGFYVDHDHETGYVRGLLCPKCNHLEGVVFKDVKLSYGIIEYKRIHELNERKI